MRVAVTRNPSTPDPAGVLARGARPSAPVLLPPSLVSALPDVAQTLNTDRSERPCQNMPGANHAQRHATAGAQPGSRWRWR